MTAHYKKRSPRRARDKTYITTLKRALFDDFGYFKDELNHDRNDGELQHCNNCGYFQHDLHVKLYCRLHKRDAWFMDAGCEHWSHWELNA